MPKEGLEYTPLVVSEGSTKKIDHIAQTQINSHSHIKNLAKLPKLKSCEFLNDGKSRETLKLYMLYQKVRLANFDQVFLLNRVKPNEKLLNFISHEYQHISDYIGISKIMSKFNLFLVISDLLSNLGFSEFKYKTFHTKRVMVHTFKCMKDGIIIPFSKKHKEYIALKKDICEYKIATKFKTNDVQNYKIYRETPLEKRAFEKGTEEYRKFYSLLLSIKDLMTKS